MFQVIPNMFHTASIWLTLALAVQRYIFVCHAPLARKFCTMPNVYKCLIYILVVAALHQSFRFFDLEYSTVSKRLLILITPGLIKFILRKINLLIIMVV